jgi:hypothetical protein
MGLDPNTGSIISKTRAKDLIKDFEAKFPNEIIGSFIGSNHINAVLAQKDCIGIRIYNGYDVKNEKISLIIVGVGKDEKELLDDGMIYDEMFTCPTNCSTNGLYL